MLYNQFIKKARDLSIIYDTPTGFYCVIPQYRFILQTNNMNPSQITDFDGVTMDDIYQDIKLTTQYLNRGLDFSRYNTNWLCDIINKFVDSQLNDSQNQTVSKFMQFMRNNKQKQSQQKQIKKQNLEKLNLSGMNFAKRVPK